jgi:hypothetical protein
MPVTLVLEIVLRPLVQLNDAQVSNTTIGQRMGPLPKLTLVIMIYQEL